MCLDLVITIFLSSNKMFCMHRYLLKRLMKLGIIKKKSRRIFQKQYRTTIQSLGRPCTTNFFTIDC